MRRLLLALTLSALAVPAAPAAAQTTSSCPEREGVRSPLVMNYTCEGLYALAAEIGADTSSQRSASGGFSCRSRADGAERSWTCLRADGETRAMWVVGGTTPAGSTPPSSGTGECATNPSSVFCSTQPGSGPGTQDESRPSSPSPSSSSGTRSCPGSGRIQGLAAVRTTCAVARATARAVGAATRARRANGFSCRVTNRTSAGRGWTCTRTRSGRRQAVSWVYVR